MATKKKQPTLPLESEPTKETESEILLATILEELRGLASDDARGLRRVVDLPCAVKPSVLYFLWFFLFASAKRVEPRVFYIK